MVAALVLETRAFGRRGSSPLLRTMKKESGEKESVCLYPHAVTDYHDFTYYEMPTARRRELNVGDIYDNKIQCKKCGYIVRSKNQHHFVSCKCGAVAVDGGSWYQRTIAKDLKDVIDHTKYFKYIPRYSLR